MVITPTTAPAVAGPEDSELALMIIMITDSTWKRWIRRRTVPIRAYVVGLELETTSEQFRSIIINIRAALGHPTGTPSPASVAAPRLDTTSRLRTFTLGVHRALSHQKIIDDMGTAPTLAVQKSATV